MSGGKKNNDNKKTLIIGGAVAGLVVVAIICFVVAICSKEDPVVAGEPYDYEEAGNLTLGDYKGIKVDVNVSDEDVEAEIESVLEDAELYVQQEGTPVEGDYISLSYKAIVDGQELEDYSDNNAFMTVGDEEIEPDFDTAVQTMKTGETKTIEITYPEEYGDELIDGKTVSYELTVNYIAGDPIKQELNDEFANTYSEGECTSADEFDEYIKETLYQDNVDCIPDTAWEIVLENAEVDKYHKGEVKIAKDETVKSYEEFAEVTGEDIMEAFGMSDEDIEDIAKDVAKERMVAKTIAVKENLTMTDDIYKNVLTEYLLEDNEDEEISSMSIEELEKYYIDMYQEEPREIMLTEYVKKFIVDNVDIVGMK